MSKYEDITGNRYGRLVAIGEIEKTPSGHHRWVCVCDCGNKKIIRKHFLKSGHTKSCGCLRKDHAKERSTIHGMSGTSMFTIWAGMIGRCTNENSKSWVNYGGRGITICEEWLSSFENFYNDMSDTFHKGLSIDRIDNNGNYCKSNCKWSTSTEQNNNKRSNVYIETENGMMTMAQASRRYGISSVKLRDSVRSGIKNEELFVRPKTQKD